MERPKTSLISAAKMGELDELKHILETGADVDARDEEGRTALHVAAMGGHGEVVQELLLAGADTEVKDNKGLTALKLAQQEEQRTTTRLILSHLAIDSMHLEEAIVRLRAKETRHNFLGNLRQSLPEDTGGPSADEIDAAGEIIGGFSLKEDKDLQR